MPNIVQRSFAGGEVSPALYGRVDQTKYATGLKTCRNFIVQRHGGAANRPGTNFIAEVNDSLKTVKFIPFIFNALQTYVLEFGDLYMRVHKNGVQQREASKNITGITQANPCVVTTTGHGYSTGDEIYISGVEGMTELNTRNFKIVHAGANAFSLQYMDGTAVDSTVFTAYTSQGTSEKVFEVVTTYAESDLPILQYVQSADIITLVHPSYPPRELTRTGDISWAITDITFGPTIEAPTSLVPASPGVGNFYKITAIDAETGEESLASATASSTGTGDDWTWDAVPGAGSYNIYRARDGVFGWIAVAGENSFTDALYNTDLLDTPPDDRQPFMGLEDSKDITGATQADPCVVTAVGHGYTTGDEVYILYIPGMNELNRRAFTITVLTVDTFELDDEDSTGYTAYTAGAAFVSGTVQKVNRTNNYPSTVTYHQQRLMFGNINNDTEKVWGSKSGLRKNFMISTPLQDDDAVTFSLVGRQVNAVKHLIGIKSLLVLTASGEWAIEGSAAGILTPSEVNPKQYTPNGSGDLPPLAVGTNALYVQARGSVIRDLGFEQQTEGYSGDELTIFASHLFDNYTLSDWTYQQIPHSVVWAVRSDGTLLGMTYVREHQIFAWHKHDFEGGTVENVTVVPEGNEDKLYLLIKRTIDGRTVRYIERMATRQIIDIEDSVFLDSSLSLDGTNTGSTTMTLTGGTDWTHEEDLTLTASASFFLSTDIGNEIHLTDSDETLLRCEITAYTSATVVTVRTHKTVPTTMRSIAITIWGKAVDEISGLWHLEGESVSVFADAFVAANPNNEAYIEVTVVSGAITLDKPYVVIHVGLPITADLETLNIDTIGVSSLADKKKNINKVTMFVESTRGVFAGQDAENLDEFKLRKNEDYDSPVALATGPIDINIESEWNFGGQVFIRQIDPLPVSVLTILPTGFIGG